jgi:hypothetical protein
MAFNAASGYGNLPNGVWSPTIYSKKTLLILKKIAVADEITNTEFSGEINQGGDTVKIIKQPTMSVADYVRGQKLESTDIIDEDVTLTVDQAKYVQFMLDDIEAKQSHVDYMNLVADAAAYAIRDAYDSNILTYMAANAGSANTIGSQGTPVTVGFGGSNDYKPLDVINRASRLMDEANVPVEGRFFAARPDFYEALRREDSKFVEAQFMGNSESAVLNPNLVTTQKIHDFKMYKSNNLASGRLIFGHKAATATAASILKNETLRSQDTFGDLNRTLFVFGRKALRTDALGTAYVTVGDV